MTANELINHDIPFLRPTDTVKTALHLMADLKLSTLPVVEVSQFQGFVLEDQLLDEKSQIAIGSLRLHHTETILKSQTHVLDTLKFFKVFNTDIAAVLNNDGEYAGIVHINSITRYFSTQSFVNSVGGILVLSVEQNNYSLSEISRIVESNDVKILLLQVHDNPENALETFITLKFNRIDLTRVIASFERFGYKIEAEFHESSFEHFDTERLEMLWKYLNI